MARARNRVLPPDCPAPTGRLHFREAYPLNNNNNNRGGGSSNNNNNRRRGRSNRQGGGGGGQQLNRIDSRARGNAPQLLEKYRKLAHDAHLNGDRVQAEYYLQFADHYFRVLADQRVRQEEGRSRPPGERWSEDGQDGEESGEYSSASDFPSFEQPSYPRQQREDRPQRALRQAQDDREQGDDDRPARPAPEDRFEAPEQADDTAGDNGSDESGEASQFEPAENPFVRDNRSRSVGLRPRRERDDRRPRRDDAADDAPAGLDPSSLPPAISVASRDEDEAEAKPRKRAVRRKPSAGDAGETLESVN